MHRLVERRSTIAFAICLLCAASMGMMTGCSGGSGGSSGDKIPQVFNQRNVNLYQEVPAIEIQGNSVTVNVANFPTYPSSGSAYTTIRDFNPKTVRTAELYDANKDGIDDSLINNLNSFCNAANRLIDMELASCMQTPGSVAVPPVPPRKQQGYGDPPNGINYEAWTSQWREVPGENRFINQYPNTMPSSAGAGGTNGTQFIQIILPFEIDPSKVFDLTAVGNDFIDANALEIVDEVGGHVNTMVLINGRDKDGLSHVTDPNLGELSGVVLDPGSGKSSIVFVAQTAVDQVTPIPSSRAFNTWLVQDEIRIHLKAVYDSTNTEIRVDSRWCILEDGKLPLPPTVLGIEALDYVNELPGQPYLDPKGNFKLIERGTSFKITFDKPVLPECVGQSIVFMAAPFNGNTEPLPTSLAINPPLPGNNPCANSGVYYDPIAPNITVLAELYFANAGGGDPIASGTSAVIPYRCYPLHQNNLATYILNPIIDLPGSSDLGSPPFINSADITRMRITLTLQPPEFNVLTGSTYSSAGGILIPTPINMGITGLLQGDVSSVGPAAAVSETFTVDDGGRYVNAPVAPNALYYAMGPYGLGVVDLDGNGFTTNNPDFSKEALVTCHRFYNVNGNAASGSGSNPITNPNNQSSFAARAKRMGDLIGGVTNTPYIGIGANTPMPGINEGSTGIDEIVKDSNGNPQLFPDPEGSTKYVNITDVELGDFLDSIYFDRGNPWAHKSLHLSPTNLNAIGNFANNLINTPPTPNPPPLSIPIGLRATDVILDEFDLSSEGAFVIMGKEVFTLDLMTLGIGRANYTGFIHLKPAGSSQVDTPFPPNAANWLNGMMLPQKTNFMNLGPVADSCTFALNWFYGSRQQIGNFLFVADKTNDAVQVLNSNTFDVITTLTSLNAPDAVAVSPDLTKLYISNSGGQSVSVYNVNPRSDKFLYSIANIWVGSQPKGICAQCDGEDVFVCNYGSNSISIINPTTNTVRKTVSALLNKPWDMVCGPRQSTFGFQTGVYHAYISNFGGDNILIYESGPDGIGGIGYDDVLDPVPDKGPGGQPLAAINDPRGLCWDPTMFQNPTLSGGCYVAHRSGSYGMISRIMFKAQQAPNGPIFLIPNSGSVGGTPGFGKRVFLVTSQWGGSSNPLSGMAATDVSFLDYNRDAWINQNWIGNVWVTSYGDLGQNPHNHLPINNKHPIKILNNSVIPTFTPDRLYISYLNKPVIDVLDPTTSQKLKTITGLPHGARVIKGYFKN